MDEGLLSRLFSSAAQGIKLDLDNIRDLLKRLGDPQAGMKYVHVGGSDGKGSVSACIASILISSGVCTGLYTSPHIEDLGERITVNGEKMTDAEAEEILNEMIPDLDEMGSEGRRPTFFEMTTAMAFLHFKKKGVEYAVLEVGMGGRLDSTNVIVPEVSVIGNISMEHTDHLGDTIGKIAFEKSGIIKPGVPCVTMNGGPAFDTIRNTAEGAGAPLTRIDPGDVSVRGMDRDGTDFTYKEESYRVSIPGRRQADNASMAIEAVSKLKIYGQCLRCNVKMGLRDVRWPCRLEKIKGLPIILDVTHTAAGSGTLAGDISALYGKVDAVVGMLSDKDPKTMAENLSRIADRVFISPLDTERTAEPELLAEAFRGRFREKNVCKSISDAMDMAMRSREDRNILVTGSFHTAEEAIIWLKRTYPGYWTYSQRSTAGEHTPEGHPKD